MNTLLLHCRPGFEGEVCAEISDQAARLGVDVAVLRVPGLRTEIGVE